MNKIKLISYKDVIFNPYFIVYIFLLVFGIALIIYDVSSEIWIGSWGLWANACSAWCFSNDNLPPKLNMILLNILLVVFGCTLKTCFLILWNLPNVN